VINLDNLKTWKIIGCISTLVIVLAIPLYQARQSRLNEDNVSLQKIEANQFVGSKKCAECHRNEYKKWEKSHHAKAMAAATPETVLGNFNNAEFEYFGITSRFYRKQDGYFVFTQGPEGKIDEFRITHTFGWYPLQQYLIPFPGGRYQCLPIAWDVENKRWYHLNPDKPLEPDDWLYWTNHGQNWNGMCAECHSTDLRKNYDIDTDTYKTTWSEINVGCEACHGPGSAHVKWAEVPEMGRPAVDTFALPVQTRQLSSRQQIALCAPCHSRRMSLDDNIHKHDDFLDYGIPQLLSPGMYHADGQILEEVYVYGSFMQSKMYARDVRCADCHDVHSIQRIKKGNDLCLQCHQAAVYDTADHHFHKKKGEKGEPIKDGEGNILFEVGSGASCEQCHMPGRVYMGIDYRPDHSFRIPRPDLTLDIGTPNACSRCHVDKPIKWVTDAMGKWYGQRRRTHYATTIHKGRGQQEEVTPDLIRLANDRLYAPIVRATALSLLAAYEEPEARKAIRQALTDEEAIMRHTAVRLVVEPDHQARVRLLAPLLYDPVRAVRIEAARVLASLPKDAMHRETQKQFEASLAEFIQSMERMADFPASRHNLGNLYLDTGQSDVAEKHYLKAIEIDSRFYPAKVNLAMLYNNQGKKEAAEKLFRQIVEDHPELHEIKYSLGLLLAEKKDYEAAALYLKQAGKGLPGRSRIQYNLGILLQQLGRDTEAEQALNQALSIEPNHPDYLYALAIFHLQRSQLDQARRIAQAMVDIPATETVGQQLLKTIQQHLEGN
jgi:tetratricopeptide (TPR) repeat protein